jgi:hypothetical protein
MISTRTRGSRGVARKSPLRLAADPVPAITIPRSPSPSAGFPGTGVSPQQLRQMMISEFGEWLRSRTNRHKRPFQAETISAYWDVGSGP